MQNRNVVLVIADCLRADATGYFQYLRQGVDYINAWATAGATVPSVFSIYTGLYPHQHGCVIPTPDIKPSMPTIKETFITQGYNILSVTENPFTRWSGMLVGDHEGFDYIRSNVPRQPYFIIYHNMYCHSPYIAGWPGWRLHELNETGYTPNQAKDLHYSYAASTARLAEDLYDLVEFLPGNPVVILTADHGEAFGEHGFLGHVANRMVGTLLHVPLIVHDRARPGAAKVTQPVSIKDIPTIATHASRGDRVSRFNDQILLSEDYQYPGGHTVAARIGRWLGVMSETFPPVYYDLKRDAHTLTPLDSVPAEPKLALSRALVLRENVGGALLPDEDQAEIEQRLKDLGYME